MGEILKVTFYSNEAVLLSVGHHLNAEIVGTLLAETTEASVQTTDSITAPAEDGTPVGLIIGIIAAVVVVALVVAVLKKKKN